MESLEHTGAHISPTNLFALTDRLLQSVHFLYVILSGYTKFSIFSFITSLSIVQCTCPFKQFSDHTFSAKPRDSHVVNCNHMNDHAVNSCPVSLLVRHTPLPMYFYFVIDTTDWWVCWRKHLYLLHGELLETLIGMEDLKCNCMEFPEVLG